MLQKRRVCLEFPLIDPGTESSLSFLRETGRPGDRETGRLRDGIKSILTQDGNIQVHFRFAEQRFKRSLRTKHHRGAKAAASHVKESIRLIAEGRMNLPEDVDVPTFFRSDGKLTTKPKVAKCLKLGSRVTKCEMTVAAIAIESTTRKTAKIHVRRVTPAGLSNQAFRRPRDLP